jgi:hypothetical protein
MAMSPYRPVIACKRRATIAVLLAVAAAVLAAAPADAAFERPRSCRSGEGIFREGPVRLFRTEGTIAGEQAFRFYVCSARIRRPRLFNETSPGLDETISTLRRSGRRVAFVSTLIGGESFDQVLGWVDLNTGRSRLTGIRDEDEGATVLAVVPDARGGIAYLQEAFDDGAQRIGYARVFRNGQLGVPRPRALVADSPVVPRSLAVSGTTITWMTESGTAGSVSTPT